MGTPFFGGGCKTSLRIVAAVCVFGPGSRRTFFLYMAPLTHGGGPGSQLRVPTVPPPPPPYGPLPVRTRFHAGWAVEWHLKKFQNVIFSETLPFCCP